MSYDVTLYALRHALDSRMSADRAAAVIQQIRATRHLMTRAEAAMMRHEIAHAISCEQSHPEIMTSPAAGAGPGWWRDLLRWMDR